MSLLWPTSYGFSCSSPSFALSVSTVGAASFSASASTSSRASRAPRPTSSVTFSASRSATAALTAASSSCVIWFALVTVAVKTATSLNNASLSTSWKKLVPISSVGTCPQIASTGACDFFASYRPLSRWIAPGPTVPMHTARRPVSCACADAANAPASSWRTPTHSMRSSRRMASTTGLSASPTTPQNSLTPYSASASTIISAIVISDPMFMLLLARRA